MFRFKTIKVTHFKFLPTTYEVRGFHWCLPVRKEEGGGRGYPVQMTLSGVPCPSHSTCLEREGYLSRSLCLEEVPCLGDPVKGIGRGKAPCLCDPLFGGGTLSTDLPYSPRLQLGLV